MNIYSCVDGKNIDKIVTLFYSVYQNCNMNRKDELRFFLITDSEIDSNLFIPEYIKNKLEIKILNLTQEWTELLNNFNTHFYKNSNWCRNDMNFARFLFFNHFPEINRVIYLDWDMIVQEDIFTIEEQYNDYENMIVSKCGYQTIFTNIFVKSFQFKNNINSLFVRSPLKKMKYHKSYQILSKFTKNTQECYNVRGFNAGFYIVSRDQFNDNLLIKNIRKLIEIQIEEKCFNFGTQVVMNIINISNRKFIEKEWNHLPNIENLEDLKIIHWNGKNKPWNSNLPTNKIWLNYYSKIYPEKSKKLLNNINYNNKVTDINKKTNKKLINKDLLQLLRR